MAIALVEHNALVATQYQSRLAVVIRREMCVLQARTVNGSSSATPRLRRWRPRKKRNDLGEKEMNSETRGACTGQPLLGYAGLLNLGAQPHHTVVLSAIDLEPDFRAGKPRLLFAGHLDDAYDVTPDGQRFLMVCRQQPSPRTRITDQRRSWCSSVLSTSRGLDLSAPFR